jgi:hypothetical protein
MISQDYGELEGHNPKGYGRGKSSSTNTNKMTMSGAEKALGDNFYPYNDKKAATSFLEQLRLWSTSSRRRLPM